MNIKVTAAIVLLLLVAATSVAGCPSLQQPTPTPTSSPFIQVTPVPTVQATPTPSPGPADAIAFFTDFLQKQHYAIKQPLTHSINSIGNDVYSGTVARGTMTASVEIQTYQSIYDTQQGGLSYKNLFIGQGYVTRDDKPTAWSGATPTGEAWIIVDTDYTYVMAFWY